MRFHMFWAGAMRWLEGLGANVSLLHSIEISVCGAHWSSLILDRPTNSKPLRYELKHSMCIMPAGCQREERTRDELKEFMERIGTDLWSSQKYIEFGAHFQSCESWGSLSDSDDDCM
jgi:hypothetical protein